MSEAQMTDVYLWSVAYQFQIQAAVGPTEDWQDGGLNVIAGPDGMTAWDKAYAALLVGKKKPADAVSDRPYRVVAARLVRLDRLYRVDVT